MTKRITLDRYIYEDIYPAFKAATDEKEITANISSAFLNYLGERNLVLAGEAPAIVADIGCGPCDTLIKYLHGVRFSPGYMLRATDYLPEYADSERGEALAVVAKARADGQLKIVDFSTCAGDAFAGNLLSLLSRDPDRDRNRFQIVFASHMLYHAENTTSVTRMISDVGHNLLSHSGVAICYHLASTPGTFQDFRSRFGSEAGGSSQSNTGFVTIDDPPTRLRDACAELRLPMSEGEFLTNLRFGKLRDQEWQAFKEPKRYDAIASANPEAYEDLKRLYFIVQRAPLEFARDQSLTRLSAFIDQVREVIEHRSGVLPLAERMQIILHKDSPAPLRDAVPKAIASSIKLS